METRDHFYEQWRERTDSSEKSKVREIYDLLKRKISLREKAREVFSTDTSLRWIWEMQKIYRGLLSLLEDKKYASFQRKIWMKESEIDGKLWESTLRKLKLYLIWEEKTHPLKTTIVHYLAEDLGKDSETEWTEKSSQSRLLTIKKFLSDEIWKTKSFPLLRKNLLTVLNEHRYRDFQRKIWMKWEEVDGKLWKKTLEFMYAYFSNLEQCKKWTEEDPSSKLNEIKAYLYHITDRRYKEEFYDLKKTLILLLNKWYYRDFQRKIWMKWEEVDGKLWKKTLEQFRRYIEKFAQESWKITLERNQDSTWNYKVYSYIVRKWGQPQHIRREYIKQIWLWKWESWIQITDSKWNEYPENKNFKANDKVFIKVPLFETIDSMSKDTKEKIKIQEDYLKKQEEDYQETLEEFNRQQPMWKDVEISFWIPVNQYDDIDKTLASITTNQKNIDPKKFEVVILLNRPNEHIPFHKETKEKILRFKKRHPEYNICIFEKTFDFQKDENWKLTIMFWEIYKTLWDTIAYRNIKRKNIKWMDMGKIRNLIIKTWAADSTDKNPRYIENQLEKYSHQIWGKEIVRIKWESRLPVEVCKAYPLIEILEFFQRHFDDEYAGWTLNRDVGLWSYKSWIYCKVNWFNKTYDQGEDKNLAGKIRKSVNHKKNSTKISMFHDAWFIWAVDESCDRWIWWMVERDLPYCYRYIDKDWNTATKEKNWNTYAIEHKWEKKFKTLEMTIENLEKNLSAFYKQRIRAVFNGKTHSNLYHGDKEKHIPWYLDSEEGKNASDEERVQWIAKNVINPIMERVLNKTDFMWLSKDDYTFYCDPVVKTEKIIKNGKEEIKQTVEWTLEIKLRDEAIEKIMKVHERKINTWYYHYR